MMRLEIFEPRHLEAINEQAATAHLRPMIGPEHIATLAQQVHSYTVMREGQPVACGGIVEYWPGRGEAWAILDAARPHDFMAIHHLARRILPRMPFNRIEAVVENGFEAGHRWLRLLGFVLEAPCMVAYGPDGKDYSLYARTH